jgi:O-antigen ligase
MRTALWVVTLIWIVGMVTVFPLGNEALEAVSVFTFDRLGFLAAAALGAVAVARHPGVLRQWGGVEWWMAVYLSIVVLSWVTTLAEKNVVDVKPDVHLLLNSFVMPYVAFLIARHGGWTASQVRAAWLILVFGAGSYLVALGLIQGLVDWRFLVAEANQMTHRIRARGPFPNAIPYSTLLAMLVPLALVARIHEPHGSLRWFLIVSCVGLIEALVLGQVRIVWLALPAALLYLAAIAPAVRSSALIASGGILAVLALAAAGIDLRWAAREGGATLQPRGSVLERIGEANPVYNRVAVYVTALNMIVHRPVLGFGFGARQFETSRGEYYASCCGVSWEWAAECAVPHNEILNELVLMGAVGLLAYLGLLRALWRLLASRRASAEASSQRALAACVQAVFVLLAITAQLHDVMYLSEVQVLFFFLAGLAVPAACTTDERTSVRRGAT